MLRNVTICVAGTLFLAGTLRAGDPPPCPSAGWACTTDWWQQQLNIRHQVTVRLVTQDASPTTASGTAWSASTYLFVGLQPPCPCQYPWDTTASAVTNASASNDLFAGDVVAQTFKRATSGYAQRAPLVSYTDTLSTVGNYDFAFFAAANGPGYNAYQILRTPPIELALSGNGTSGLTEFSLGPNASIVPEITVDLQIGTTPAVYGDRDRWIETCYRAVPGDVFTCTESQPECWTTFGLTCPPPFPRPEFVPSYAAGRPTISHVKVTAGPANGPNQAFNGVLGTGTPSAVRLGIHTSPDFVLAADGSGGGVSVVLGTTLPTGSSSVRVEATTRTFEYHNPDLDANGVVNWLDRAIVVFSLNSTLNSAAYDARADWNFDGTVTLSDLTSYLVVWTVLACDPDYDSSGASNTADLFAFLNDWFSSSPLADFNANGTVDNQDNFDFLNAFFAGC